MAPAVVPRLLLCRLFERLRYESEAECDCLAAQRRPPLHKALARLRPPIASFTSAAPPSRLLLSRASTTGSFLAAHPMNIQKKSLDANVSWGISPGLVPRVSFELFGVFLLTFFQPLPGHWCTLAAAFSNT